MFDLRANDGSRQFAALPEASTWEVLRDHISTLRGAAVIGFVTDGVTEAWIDFVFEEHHFSVNNQFGEYWFFVQDPTCPESVLRSVVLHCETLLGHGERSGG